MLFRSYLFHLKKLGTFKVLTCIWVRPWYKLFMREERWIWQPYDKNIHGLERFGIDRLIADRDEFNILKKTKEMAPWQQFQKLIPTKDVKRPVSHFGGIG